jgi:hypothetical protein
MDLRNGDDEMERTGRRTLSRKTTCLKPPSARGVIVNDSRFPMALKRKEYSLVFSAGYGGMESRHKIMIHSR